MNTDWPIFMAVKYITSVATLKGDRQTMVEFCAPDIEGANMTDAQKQMIKTTLNLMYFQGITDINSYFALEYMGTEKKSLTDYFGRLSYISKNAKWDGQIGMYYPINTNQAYSIPSYTATHNTTSSTNCINTLADKLFKAQMDFTVVDNQFILEAEVKDGVLFTENVSFTAICMPGVEVLPLDVMKKLDQFEKSGGTVIWIDCLPTLADKSSECDELVSMVSGKTVMNYREAGAAVKDAVADKLVIKRETPSLYVGRYVLDDAPMYWLYNSHDMDKSLTLTYEGAKGFDVYDPATGEITSLSGESISVDIAKLHAKLVIVRL
jgi:hypothetical protein